MEIKYQYFKSDGYVISTPRGLVTLQDVKDYAHALFEDEAITGPFIEVVNFEYTNDFDFGYFEAEELLASFIKLKELKGYKGACLVVNQDVTKSMSNILRNVSKDTGIVIRTFKSLEHACKYAKLDNA